MNRDPEMYPQPDDFLPERFFEDTAGPFTSIGGIHAFGFGRRSDVLPANSVAAQLMLELQSLYRKVHGR